MHCAIRTLTFFSAAQFSSLCEPAVEGKTAAAAATQRAAAAKHHYNLRKGYDELKGARSRHKMCSKVIECAICSYGYHRLPQQRLQKTPERTPASLQWNKDSKMSIAVQF